MSKYILLTGGLGYIGTHLAYALIEEGYKPIIVDNLSNSYLESLNNLNILCNEKIIFKELDITDYSMLVNVVSNYKIDSIINLAAKKTSRKMRNSFRLKLKPPNDRFFVKKSTNLSIQLKYKMIEK